METYESEVQRLHNTQSTVYNLLADLRHFEPMKEQLPEEAKKKIKSLTFEQDKCCIEVDPVGMLTFCVVEREPEKTIKFGGENSPINFNLWIQLKTNSLNETLMKITLKVDLPFMLKAMMGKKLEDGVKKIAEHMAQVL